MTVLHHLLRSAQADLGAARRWYDQTQDPEWLRLAADAAAQVEAFEASLAREQSNA
jgi:hypothetical protein